MPSFDTVLEPNLVEVKNAVDQTAKEIGTRFDFKGSSARVELKDKEITLFADNEFQIGQVHRHPARQADQAQRRRALPRPRAPRSRRSAATRSSSSIVVKSGIDGETAKKLQTLVKQSKLKVQAVDPGRHGARHRRQARRPAGGDGADPQGNRRPAALVQQLPRLSRCALVAAAALAAGSAPARPSAQTVSMGGSLGSNALLVIDGKPRSVAVGATVDGVQLVSVTRQRRGGRGQGQARRAAPRRRARSTSAARRATAAASRSSSPRDSGGHFVTNGTINGKAVALHGRHRRDHRRRWARPKPSASASTTRTASAACTQHRQRRDRRLPRHARLGADRRRPGLQRRGDRAAGADAVHPARQQLPDRFQMRRENDG